MRIASLCILIFLFTWTGICQKQIEDDKEVLSSFCRLSLPGDVKISNISFTGIYSFRIDEHGKVTGLKEFAAKYPNYIKFDEVETCMKTWTFFGFPEATIGHVEFNWIHGLGWTRMRISSKTFSQTTVLGDDPRNPE